MTTRWRWYRFKLKNMKFLLIFVTFQWILMNFCQIFDDLCQIFDDFCQIFNDFCQFSMIFANFSMIFGISCAHFGTEAQCSVDPQCASSAKTKHLETSQKLSETLKKNHETSRKQIFFEFRSISMNFQMYQNQKQSKCVQNQLKFSQKTRISF